MVRPGDRRPMITDHAMPGTTGLQLAKIAREEKPELPILLATGYAEIDPSAGIQLPRIGKPFLQHDLKVAIDKYLDHAPALAGAHLAVGCPIAVHGSP